MLKANFLDNFDFSCLNDPEFKEDAVREEIIMPLLHSLGYSASGMNRIIRSKILAHPFVNIGSEKRKISIFPDYLLAVEGKPCWVLDAKGPSETITSGKNVEQTFSYAIHPEVRALLFALCNGKEFVLFSVSDKQPILQFKLEELPDNYNLLFNKLSPSAFSVAPLKSVFMTEESPKDFDYDKLRLLGEIKNLKKQGAKRHFGVHPYFTRQSWDVVNSYIRHFTKVGDVVCDPFGGSGVTATEAVMLKRKAIHIDINPLSVFLTKNLIEPVPFDILAKEYERIRKEFIEGCPKTEEEFKSALETYPHPKRVKLPKDSDVDFIEGLFSTKQLAQLAFLKFLIKTSNKSVRGTLMLMFSGLLNKINLTYHASGTRTEGRGDSGPFRYYRYRIAPKPVDLDLMKYFDSRFKKVVAAKKEMEPFISKAEFKDATIFKGTATNLNTIPSESVDYIYADPPYGAKIKYLDLSIMWNAWLDLEVSEEDKENEAIIGGEKDKSVESYYKLLGESINEMYRILKYDRWLSFVYAHKDPLFWHLILGEAEKAGFEYMGAMRQSNDKITFKKVQNPLTVLCGELIISFKKSKTPRVVIKTGESRKLTDIVIETIEGVIGRNHGATIEEINDELIMKGLEYGFLDLLSKEYRELSLFLNDSFDLDTQTKKYHIREKSQFKSQLDVKLRIRYFLISYLRRCESEGKYPTFDDVVLYIMPLLKNGITPEKQTILGILEELAAKFQNDKWRLKKEAQLSLF